jgi:cytoskeletal protein CcmA (bactofilin family)
MINLRLSQPKSLTAVLAGVLMTLLVAGAVSSHTLETDDKIHLSSLHNIDDDLYAFGNEVQIEGSVAGDLVVGCYIAIIKGDIGGSTNIFANTIDFSGRSENSIRCFGQRVMISGSTGRSLVAFGSEVILHQGAVVERDAGIFGGLVRFDGMVKGNVTCEAKSITITGQIDGNLDAKGEKITVSPPAVITGNVTYETKEQDAFVQEPGVTILGDVTWKPPEEEEDTGAGVLASLTFKISCLLAAFIFGIIVTASFKPYAQESFKQLRQGLVASFAAGVVALLVFIFAVIVLVLSSLLALAAYLMLSSNLALLGVLILVFSIVMLPITSFASVVGGIVFYSAVILVAFALGYLIYGRYQRTAPEFSKLSLLIGLVILVIVFSIPFYIGWVLWILVTILGAGAITLGFKNCRRETVARLEEISGGEENRPTT